MKMRARVASTLALLAPATLAQTPAPPTTPIPFDQITKVYDWKTQTILIALPPGFEFKGDANGEYAIHFVVKGGGTSVFETDLAFTERKTTALTDPGLPPGAKFLRLSASPEWPKHMAELDAAREKVTADYPAGQRDLSISLKFTSSIAPEWKDNYCRPGARYPLPRLLLESGDPPHAQLVDTHPIEDMLVAMVKNACKTDKAEPAAPT